MHTHNIEHIDRGADVYARDGHWIGTVGSVLDAPAGPVRSRLASQQDADAARFWLEVGMGLAHPGKALYVPDSAVALARPDWVMLDMDHTEIERHDWRDRPRQSA